MDDSIHISTEYKYLTVLCTKGNLNAAKVYYATNKNLIQLDSGSHYLIREMAKGNNLNIAEWAYNVYKPNLNNQIIDELLKYFITFNNWKGVKWIHSISNSCFDTYTLCTKDELFLKICSSDLEHAKWFYENNEIGSSTINLALENSLNSGQEIIANWILSLDHQMTDSERKQQFYDACRNGDIDRAKCLRKELGDELLNLYSYDTLFKIYTYNIPHVMQWILESMPVKYKTIIFTSKFRDNKNIDPMYKKIFTTPTNKFMLNYIFVEACTKADTKFMVWLHELDPSTLRITNELFENICKDGNLASAQAMYRINNAVYQNIGTNVLINKAMENNKKEIVSWLRSLEPNIHRVFQDACTSNNIALANYLQSIDCSYNFKHNNGYIIDWEITAIIEELKLKYGKFLVGTKVEAKKFENTDPVECSICCKSYKNNIICPCDFNHLYCESCLSKMNLKCAFCSKKFTKLTVYNPA